ncbi:uncharacterized protein LOC112575471 [Pomacea canaliculata]|uniref:uncharacterized protein LOC112575471 n=1 Tax=Pomacea canaliculata TaxID=400727 RepID=UPI000D7324C9|nr:uncharacterized protein LOC112575471 [Pomacea canaliculata]XP_025113145.1 uncharacterized protein LOC112575471 [Pomacea canaliculata]XP_025113146.1 uncharacterized protein LOC112575471 [Pomacea canaliculata]
MSPKKKRKHRRRRPNSGSPGDGRVHNNVSTAADQQASPSAESSPLLQDVEDKKGNPSPVPEMKSLSIHDVPSHITQTASDRITNGSCDTEEQKQLAIPGQPPSTAQQLQGDQRQKTESDEQARGKCHVQDNMSASTDHQDSIPADNSPTPQEKKCADVQMDSKQSEHVPVVASVSDGPPTMKASVDVNSVPEGNDRLSSGRRGQAPGGGRVKVYFHAISDQQESLLKGDTNLLLELKEKTGADVEFDSMQSPVSGMKILIIHCVPQKVEEAIRLISVMCDIKETMLEQAQKFWLQWVEASFPALESRAYFLPPVYFNRVPMTRQSLVGQDILILQSEPGQSDQHNQPAIIHSTVSQTLTLQPSPFQNSDVRDDEAFERVFLCLQRMSEQNSEVLVVLSQFRFGQYLSEPWYAAMTAELPMAKNLPNSLSRDRQGEFDMLVIHRLYGFVVCEVKSLGKSSEYSKMTDLELKDTIRKKLRDAVSQLDKAEAMLSHLVSDIAPGLRVTKTIAVPNLEASTVQEVVSGDSKLFEDMCQCLRTEKVDIICYEQLSDPKTPWNVSTDVQKSLGKWWKQRVANAGPDSQMTYLIYKTLVARFCGPATTVSVPCTCPPRVSVKTLGQAVWWTGECYTAVITLFPEQVHLLNKADTRVFVSGPPGTGKTVVLLLMAIEWLRGGHDVYIISVWLSSRATCTMLYYLLDHSLRMQQTSGVTPGRLHLLKYDFSVDKATENAVSELSVAAEKGSLHVIADETGLDEGSQNFQTFCNELLSQVPGLHLWAASCFHGDAPTNWQVEYLTRPLRSPPAVVREVALDPEINHHKRVKPYSERGVPHHTDGPPVRRLYHGGQSHSGDWPGECKMCGDEVSRFLKSLRDGETSVNRDVLGETTPPCLQWRDILVLDWGQPKDNSGIIEGLQEAGIPVRVMKEDDIEDVATARSDVVWMADGDRVRGLERKVVVCLKSPCVNDQLLIRLHNMSRCTSQLVIISSEEHRFDGVSPTEYIRTWRDSLCCVC